MKNMIEKKIFCLDEDTCINFDIPDYLVWLNKETLIDFLDSENIDFQEHMAVEIDFDGIEEPTFDVIDEDEIALWSFKNINQTIPTPENSYSGFAIFCLGNETIHSIRHKNGITLKKHNTTGYSIDDLNDNTLFDIWNYDNKDELFN